ncbi:MAG: hypothetical protein N2595_04420 [bacterium]|nr:hypothetical protein [bacterium]
MTILAAVAPSYAAISNLSVLYTTNEWTSSVATLAHYFTGIVYQALLPTFHPACTVRYTAVASDTQGQLAYAQTNLFIVYHGASSPDVTCRVMSANITSGNYQAYEEPGIRVFQGLKPDIVGIQEFNYRNGTLRQLVDLAFGTGFYFYVEPGSQSIPNGVVSRWPIVAAGEWDDPYVPDRDFAWATIDLPGPRMLHIVSAHLWSSGGASGRNNQAILLTNHIRRMFPSSDFVVLAADLNTDSRTEPALTTLKTILRDSKVPVDKNNNDKTNEPRTKPYDYVLPNPSLDSNHVPVTIDGYTYPYGLVFDSAVWHDTTPPPPVLPGDSHVPGMQHMPVLKDFLLPGSPPNRPPSLSPLNHHLLHYGSTLSFPVVAYDPDGDPVHLTCSDPPHFSSPPPAPTVTGWFTWTPQPADIGEHALLFSAAAAGQQANLIIAVSVIPEASSLITFALSLCLVRRVSP